MSLRLPKITIEQWAAFKAVVDEGGHAAAAEALHKSQSTISYLIARLNDQLPSPALMVRGRKAELTELGKSLYRQASSLLVQALACEQMAAYLATGHESEITIACDALTPMSRVACALQAFATECPFTRIRILETSLSGTDEAILQHDCDLAVTPSVPPGFLAKPLTSIAMLAVAHAQHTLCRQTTISETELKSHRQIVVRDSGLKREQNAGWLGSEQRWTVSHFSTSLEMVRRGSGFAFLPEHRIATLLETGELQVLPLEFGACRVVPLSILPTSAHPGPGAMALMSKIIAEFQNILEPRGASDASIQPNHD